ncbi:hypothetical protein AZI98_12855 [Aeribacillus pallidus]|uniref:Uncharacterized protein n=1 Tax=Aeribacillus pallidus TaxID=33936 RepID=A0A165X5M0_9BACI|nr:hypothetical protein [Aeribacillus pallidus]KZN95660.1 hypothetical protein AZI98_12855 [Aeribacillus pallidus]
MKLLLPFMILIGVVLGFCLINLINMKLLLPFMTLIGVVLGFCLNLIKDYIQNKPKIRTGINESSGKFNYYKNFVNENGFDVEKIATPDEASFLELKIKIDVYNIGKSDTAIKDLMIDATANNTTMSFQPELKINGETNKDYTFNVKSGSITTLDYT